MGQIPFYPLSESLVFGTPVTPSDVSRHASAPKCPYINPHAAARMIALLCLLSLPLHCPFPLSFPRLRLDLLSPALDCASRSMEAEALDTSTTASYLGARLGAAPALLGGSPLWNRSPFPSGSGCPRLFCLSSSSRLSSLASRRS
jgi:hypothetical protein